MNGIKARSYSVEFKQNGFNKLEKLIENNDYSSVFVIVDTNTREHCLPVFKKEISKPFHFETISISPGEEFKTIISCQNIWQILSDKGADRRSLIINLGGGVITDMGGFIASTYKRGSVLSPITVVIPFRRKHSVVACAAPVSRSPLRPPTGVKSV